MVTAAMVALLVGMQHVRAQRPVGDTIIGMEPTYMYYIYDWWRCANHDPESPQWYASSGVRDVLFHAAYYNNSSVRACYSGPRPDIYDSDAQSDWYNYSAGNDIRGVQMVTDRPIKIVGVAACAYAQQPHDTTLSWYLYELGSGAPTTHLFPNTRDVSLAGRFTDSLMLLKPTSYEPTYLAGGPWRVEDAHRYMPLPMWINSLMGDTITYAPDTVVHPSIVYDSAPVVPLYEVMFDKPQVVTDSFIVAGTANNNEGSYAIQYAPGNENLSQRMWLWDKRPTRYWCVNYWYNPDVIGVQTDLGIASGQNILWYKYRSVPWIRMEPWGVWSILYIVGNVWGDWLYAPVIFPIIDPEFDTVLCDAVSDVRLVSATDTTLTLAWNGGNDVQWEVQYMEMNGWDVWTETTNVPMVTLTGLRERTNYAARVRGMCEWDTEYGEWSGWLDVYTGAHHDDPDPVGIGNLGRFTQMMPNPARGQVTVLSSYRLSHVVVYDLKGNVVLEQEAEGLTDTFDVGTLAKGVYVVAIHTPAGIATKRLVVE